MTWLYTSLPFDPVKDFSGVTPLAELPSVIVVPVQRNWNSLKDMIAAAKARPGALNFGSGGTGSGTHLSSEKLILAAGISAHHVPYKGTAQAVPAMLSGEVALVFSAFPSILQHVKAGRVKLLAVNTAKRSPYAPDVPTVAEVTGLRDFDYPPVIGVLTPARTPRT